MTIRPLFTPKEDSNGHFVDSEGNRVAKDSLETMTKLPCILRYRGGKPFWNEEKVITAFKTLDYFFYDAAANRYLVFIRVRHEETAKGKI